MQANTMTTFQSRAELHSNDQVTLRDLLSFLNRNRWIALIAAFSFAVIAALVAELLPPEYTATVTILPVTPKSGSLGLGSIGASLSQFSGLASLAGINLNNSTGLKAEALATLQSRLLTNMYIQKHNLMPILFAKEWNASKRKWKYSDPTKDPTLWDADQLFARKIRHVSTNAKAGITTLTVKWRNAKLAAQWANGLVRLTNSYLRQQALAQSNREIAYLTRQIPRTNIVAVKTAIYSLMEQEIKSAMIANGRVDFALRVVDPAMTPKKKSFPKPILWTIAGGLAGLMLGYFAAIIRETLRHDETPPPSLTAHGATPTATESDQRQ